MVWLLVSSCHHLFPPLPHPLFPLTGASTVGEADVLAATHQGSRRVGLQQGACLHCDAGRFFRHLLFYCLLERVLS